ncbi:unnamed protein product [Ceratitis capitata]|uniref:(Mediterranean fruit fly) hypothetical protein n=1 Tax=Ceratitis capitata TaxID=7213 RepID=A0A811UVS9_CERCA|nr:unnamed protein product [Ceratitis capitata]
MSKNKSPGEIDGRHSSNMYTAETVSDGSLRVRMKRSTEEEIPCQPNTSVKV